jgi:hypothetical protein
MSVPLSPARLRSARRGYYTYNIFNSFSFVFVSGSFITLFAISLGASKAIVGVLNAIAYGTFFLMPAGKKFVRNKPIVWVFGWAWVARYSAMLPVLLAPLLAIRGHVGAAIGLLIAGTAGFAVFRGIALIGNNPLLDNLASGGGDRPRSDRGAFMVNVSIINSLASMLGGLVIALTLGVNASPWTYSICIAVGIGAGYIGCIFLLRLPEPGDYKPDEKTSLLTTTKEALKDPNYRRFLTIFMMLSFASGMGRSFLPVYAKEAFHQGDDAVMVYSILASLGSIGMGLLTRLIVDRLGSKPLFIIFSTIGLISFLPVAIFPSGTIFFKSPTLIALMLTFIHFFSAFGFAGEESTGQTYYFSLVPKEKTLDLAVVYYFGYGLGGAIGSGTGGVLLELFSSIGKQIPGGFSYRILYGLLCVILVLIIISMRKLPHLGSASVSQSLGVIFSVRDLKAFDLLAKLDRSANPHEEVKLIQELGRSASTRSQAELLDYLSSPRFEVRMEALLAFETMPTISSKVARSLIHEVETHVYTTAYVAARALGRHGRAEAIPILRKSVEAEDYMLQGTSVLALARIGDKGSIPLIESVLMRSTNPRVKISAAYSLELLESTSSLPVLVSSIRRDDPPAFVSDEIVLAIAAIMGIMEQFYQFFSAFLDDESEGISMLRSAAQDIIADKQTLLEWEKGLEQLFDKDKHEGAIMSAFIMRIGYNPQIEIVMSDALNDPNLTYNGFKFLCASYPLYVAKTT